VCVSGSVKCLKPHISPLKTRCVSRFRSLLFFYHGQAGAGVTGFRYRFHNNRFNPSEYNDTTEAPPESVAAMLLKEIHMPKFPECWGACGSCGQGAVSVLEVLVAPGDCIARDDTILVLETGKVALDIPSPWAGVVQEVRVAEGDPVNEGELLMTLL
jgi:biotin carboxyl carrier protein